MNLLPKPKKITEKGGQLLLCHSMYIVISKEISDNGIYAAKKTAGSNTAGNRAFASAFRRRNKGWRFLS